MKNDEEKKDEEKSFFKRLSGDSSCCGGRRIVSVRQIDVGGKKIGIKGLDETLEGYYYAGNKPEDLTGDELIAALGQMNPIEEGSEDAYKEAFLREYRKYYESRKK
ncbi:MAG: hypothetical protein SVE93_04965 [Candidatus Thermoplasmatota archaeon]|nr:hypothetical protein [Candidatus Thermoplasmatota archaeon]